MKRSRGRNRRSANPANRSYDSNGPEVRVRGNATQIYEKYQSLARDAQAAGDRVQGENLLQHAEHYYRLMIQNQPPKREGDDAQNEALENIGENASQNMSDTTAAEDNSSNETGDDAADETAKPARRRGALKSRRQRVKAENEATPEIDAADAANELEEADNPDTKAAV